MLEEQNNFKLNTKFTTSRFYKIIIKTDRNSTPFKKLCL